VVLLSQIKNLWTIQKKIVSNLDMVNGDHAKTFWQENVFTRTNLYFQENTRTKKQPKDQIKIKANHVDHLKMTRDTIWNLRKTPYLILRHVPVALTYSSFNGTVGWGRHSKMVVDGGVNCNKISHTTRCRLHVKPQDHGSIHYHQSEISMDSQASTRWPSRPFQASIYP